MKRISFPALIYLFYSFSAQAQFSFGVKAGVNIDYLVPGKDLLVAGNSSLKLVPTSGTGYHIGTFGKLSLSEKVFFIPELQYIHHNYTDSDDGLRSNSIELPLLLSYSPISFLNIDLGPGFNYITSSSYREFGKKKDGQLDEFNLNANAGVRFNLPYSIAVIARYSYGFLPVTNVALRSGPSPSPWDETEYKSRVLLIGLSYQIK